MRTFRSVGVVGAALLAMSAAACGGATSQGVTTDGGRGGPESGTGGVDGGGTDAGAETGRADTGATSPMDAGADASPGDGGQTGDFLPCPDPTPLLVNGQNTGFVECGDSGVVHRVSAAACPLLLPRAGGGACMGSQIGFDAGAVCASDSDCTAKPYGTCDLGDGHFPTCGCSYGCVQDSDCAAGEICQCGDPVGSCVSASCTLDSSCKTGSLCASSPVGWGGCSWSPLPQAYACESAADTCLTSIGCPAMDPVCGLGPDSGTRSCGPAQQACPGRPFLVERSARVAGVATRRDWAREGIKPAVGGLDPSVSLRLTDYWTRTAQMEHASVAAFARFALELLALGAPVDLMVATNQAMADEIEHARIAYALAGAYAGADVGPGPLAMDGALQQVTPQSVFANLVREGCIGETLAAVAATEASVAAKDETVRAALAQIAEDETRHAALAWRVARWLVERGGEVFRSWAEEETARAVAEHDVAHRRAGTSEVDDESLTEHGVVGPRTYRELTRAVLRDLVEPTARQVLGQRGVELRASTLSAA